MKGKDFSPVHVRTRKIAQGKETIYLDIVMDGMRKKEYLGLYLVPENTRADKIANRATMRIAEEIKAKRLVELIAKQYWIDAGYDAGAAVIPFVPAGVSKVVKGGTKVAKGLGEVSSTRKGLKNADAIAEGRKFEADELKRAIGDGKNVSSQTRLFPKMERETLRVIELMRIS